MSNVEQQKLVFNLNSRYQQSPEMVVLADLDDITDARIFNQFAKQNVLDHIVSLVRKAAQDTPNLKHYKKLIEPRLEYKEMLSGIASDSGISFANKGWSPGR